MINKGLGFSTWCVEERGFNASLSLYDDNCVRNFDTPKKKKKERKKKKNFPKKKDRNEEEIKSVVTREIGPLLIT
jgi:hypothetical protein